ncbi:MAG: hypothetical protein ACOCUU_03670 [Nanoarchaeota archaeon]
MKKSQIKSIMHNLLDLQDYKNPLQDIFVTNKISINLLTSEIFGIEKDSLYKLYKEKSSWFQNRINDLDGKKYISEAKIFADGHKEKVEIVFNREKFSQQRIF